MRECMQWVLNSKYSVWCVSCMAWNSTTVTEVTVALCLWLLQAWRPAPHHATHREPRRHRKWRGERAQGWHAWAQAWMKNPQHALPALWMQHGLTRPKYWHQTYKHTHIYTHTYTHPYCMQRTRKANITVWIEAGSLRSKGPLTSLP